MKQKSNLFILLKSLWFKNWKCADNFGICRESNSYTSKTISMTAQLGSQSTTFSLLRTTSVFFLSCSSWHSNSYVVNTTCFTLPKIVSIYKFLLEEDFSKKNNIFCMQILFDQKCQKLVIITEVSFQTHKSV